LVGSSDVLAAIVKYVLSLGETEACGHLNLPGRDYSGASFSVITLDSTDSVSVLIADGQLANGAPEGLDYISNITNFTVMSDAGNTPVLNCGQWTLWWFL
jgi:hypothetical protein